MQGLIIGIVIVWVGLDQALKFWTLANVPFPTVHMFQPFPAFMSLAHVVNTGAAWSLFSGATPVLIAVRVIVGTGLLIWLLRKPRSLLENIAFSFIVAGAWGNAIDGILYGHVVDMLQSHWLTAIYRIIQPNQIFPIFNLADVGVVGGVLLLIGSSFLPTKKPLVPVVNEPQAINPVSSQPEYKLESETTHLEQTESSHLEQAESSHLEQAQTEKNTTT